MPKTTAEKREATLRGRLTVRLYDRLMDALGDRGLSVTGWLERCAEREVARHRRSQERTTRLPMESGME